MTNDCDIAFEWCPVPDDASPDIVTSRWELSSAILMIVWNFLEYLAIMLIYNLSVLPQIGEMTQWQNYFFKIAWFSEVAMGSIIYLLPTLVGPTVWFFNNGLTKAYLKMTGGLLQWFGIGWQIVFDLLLVFSVIYWDGTGLTNPNPPSYIEIAEISGVQAVLYPLIFHYLIPG